MQYVHSKKEKNPGIDDILNEIIQLGEGEFTLRLKSIFNKILYLTEMMPLQ